MITRRYFIRASAIAAAGFGAAPSWLLRAAAQGESRRKILVAVFQRGVLRETLFRAASKHRRAGAGTRQE